MSEHRPPPYFPQSQLSPPDPNRFKKFKGIVALVIIGALALVAAIGYGIYYVITKLFAA